MYMTTWKTIDLTIRIFVSKVMSLLFNILSRFVVAFLSRSTRFLEVMVSTLDSEFSYKWDHDMISFFKVFSPLNSVLSPSMQFDVHYFSLPIIFHSIDLKKKVIHDNCSRWWGRLYSRGVIVIGVGNSALDLTVGEKDFTWLQISEIWESIVKSVWVRVTWMGNYKETVRGKRVFWLKWL